MGSQALSQDELNLLLNDMVTTPEDVPGPDGVSAASLTENDVAGFPGTVEMPPRENMGARHESSRGDVAGFPGTVEMPPRENMGAQRSVEKKVMVQPVQFTSLDAADSKKEGGVNKLELIYDVGLQLTVELGRTEKTLKEILEIGPGSIVGLDKLAGEALDILVNGKILARGEVIVIDENYGVRIKEIVNSGERIGLKA